MSINQTQRPPSAVKPSESGQREVRAALVNQLYAQSIVTTHVGLLAAILLTVAFWNHVEHHFLLVWLLAFLTIQAARYRLVSSFTGASPQGDDAIQWGTRFVFASSATQMWWGLSGIVLFPDSSQFLQFLLAVSVTIVAASVAVAHAPLSACYLSSVLLTGMPMVGRLFYQGEESTTILGMIGLVYTVALLGTGWAAHKMMAESVRLRIEKNDLVAELQDAGQNLERKIVERTAQLVEANDQLRREIDERTRVQKKLNLFSLVIEQCQEGIAVIDLEGNLLYLNESFARMHGYEREDLRETHFSIFHAPEHIPAVYEAIRVAQETGSFDGELWHVRRGNEAFPTLMNCSSLADSRGIPIGMIGIITDITQLKYAERSLEAEKQKFQALVDHAPFGMVMLNRDDDFLYVNTKFTEIFGYCLEEIPNGKRWFELIFPDEHERQKSLSAWMNTLNGSAEESNENGNRVCPVHVKDGSKRVVSFMVVELHDGDKVVSCEDITARKEAEDRLENSLAAALHLRGEAEAANLAKSHFLAMMSHEIRTPLNAIIGFSEMMHDQIPGPLSNRQQAYMGHVLDNGKRLLGLLNGLLDLSSIEAGKLTLTRSRVNMSSIFEASLTMVKEETARHDVTLTLCVSDGLSNLCVFADELRLRQIIFNLMSNAAKFTPAGGTIHLEAREDPDHLTISVRDTGIGIRTEDHHRIFNAFEQVEGSYSRPYQGSGLGLALTKKLVELHGGQIWVQSEGQGKGSTFSFTIPTEKSESEAKGTDATSMLSSLLPKRDL